VVRHGPVIWLVRSAMCALYPGTDGLPGIRDMDLDGYLRRFRRETTPLLWVGVLAGSFLFAITPLITIGIPLPAFLLPKGALDRHAYGITYHRIYLLRQSVFLVKMAASLYWGARPEVREAFNLPLYPPDPGTFRTR